jgi:hypothetical protein
MFVGHYGVAFAVKSEQNKIFYTLFAGIAFLLEKQRAEKITN